MAQRHEIEAWIDHGANPPGEVDAVADMIEATGSDDEAVWARCVTEYDQLSDRDTALVILEAAARDYDRAGEAHEDARQVMRSHVAAAARAGLSEQAIADAVGVTRMTIRSWLGK